jgi:hypothetical protein
MSGQSAQLSRVPWSVSHRLVLMTMWLVTTVVLVVMLLVGVRDTGRFRVARDALQVAYVAALLWYLGRTGPALSGLPDLKPLVLPHRSLGRWIPVAGVALLFAWTAVSGDRASILRLLMMIGVGPILIVWRRGIRLRTAIVGLVVAAIAFLGGLPFWVNGFLSSFTFALMLAFTPLMFIAGGLLLQRTGLGGSQLHAGRYGKALGSFLWGCLLFVPLGLLNAASGSPGGNITWVNHWWMPLSLPWFSGITEEAWFRLYLVSLCYWLLRPAFGRRPTLAVVSAVLFSAITFGLGHGPTLDHFLYTGLLYGLPMAVVFARRDWEHTVGAHYMINMIPWVMVFLET